MGRSRHDHALWARIARRGGTDPAREEPTYLQVDPTSGALVVTGAGAAASATGLRLVGSTAPGEAAVGADGAVLVREVTGAGLTDAQLRATPVPVATGLAQPLTDTQLRAAAVPVATGLAPLTDTQLRAAAVPVATGLAPLTDAQLRATAVPVATGLAQPLTDTQLRATPLNVITQVDAVTLLVLADTTYTASGATAALPTDSLTRIAVDLMVTAASGVAQDLRFSIDRQGGDSRWYPIWTSAAATAPVTISTTIGQGMAVAHSLAAAVRLRWEITGTTPSFTFGGSVIGK